MTLEALLKTKGYALVPTSDGYHILPVTEAPRNVTQIQKLKPASVDLPGFAVQVVPLKFTNDGIFRSRNRNFDEPLFPEPPDKRTVHCFEIIRPTTFQKEINFERCWQVDQIETC